MTQATALPMSTSLSFDAETPPPDWVARFVDDIPTGVAVFDRERRYVAANGPWANAFRLAVMALAGQRHDELDHACCEEFAELQCRALAGEVVSLCETVECREGGQPRRRTISFRPRRTRDGRVVGVIAALQEVPALSIDRTAQEGSDWLTGIAGRDAFLAQVRAVISGPDGPAGGVAMFLIDIDDFKGINDLYGTRTGDQVLKTIAARLLTAAESETDLVARVGADEFGVILGGAAGSGADAEAVARQLLQLVAAPVVVGDQRIRLTGNVGYLISSPAHRSEDDVLRDLNVALQEAKTRGSNSISAWEPSLTSTVGRRLGLLNQLRRALDEGEFVLHYQPIVTLANQRVVGAEALLRWNHPSEGLLPPADFLPLLEESGLIVPVGCWVIREVVRQMQIWRMLYGRDMLEWVSVNVSARQFNDPSLLLSTLGEINDNGFALDRLKLEITESAVMRNPAATRTVLGELKDVGIRIALDDFGTGYSALGALRHYSVDTIKIDRDFTTRLGTDDGRELVLALLKIARIYGAAVVAEGVETAAEHDILHRAGCEFGQGYLFAKPMDGSFFGAYALTHLVGAAAARPA